MSYELQGWSTVHNIIGHDGKSYSVLYGRLYLHDVLTGELVLQDTDKLNEIIDGKWDYTDSLETAYQLMRDMFVDTLWFKKMYSPDERIAKEEIPGDVCFSLRNAHFGIWNFLDGIYGRIHWMRSVYTEVLCEGCAESHMIKRKEGYLGDPTKLDVYDRLEESKFCAVCGCPTTNMTGASYHRLPYMELHGMCDRLLFENQRLEERNHALSNIRSFWENTICRAWRKLNE